LLSESEKSAYLFNISVSLLSDICNKISVCVKCSLLLASEYLIFAGNLSVDNEELNDLYSTHYCAGDKIEKNDMGGACSAYGGGDLQEVGCGVWTGLSWLRIETGGGHLCKEPSSSIKSGEFFD
jgi:hypothetical protein